ncbi:MAG: paaB [Alphaproteobacteria bacterium]|nr:paaB [Alphaproteobacteria bacterium]
MADPLADDSDQAARLTIDGAVATITLNRPQRLNAFNLAMHEALRAALDRVEQDDSIRALIVTGAGRAFSAGQDLGDRAAAFEAGTPPDLGALLELHYNRLILRIAALPIPVIAAVNGVAFGAGAGLAIACDIAIAGGSAQFVFGFCRVGLGPDAGTSWFLPHRAGPGRALALMLTGEAIDAARAEQIGLVARTVADDALAHQARALADGFANGPREALAAAKQQMRTGFLGSLEAALASEAAMQRRLGATEDYREAVAAFAEKRPPRFR